MKRHTFAHAVTTQLRVNISARLEQGGFIPNYLVQLYKEMTSLRKASYELRSKHVELTTTIYFLLRQYITIFITSYLICVLCKGLKIFNRNMLSRSS